MEDKKRAVKKWIENALSLTSVLVTGVPSIDPAEESREKHPFLHRLSSVCCCLGCLIPVVLIVGLFVYGIYLHATGGVAR
jgi:hypothetical protein